MTSCPCERCHRARTGSHSTRPPSRTQWCRRTAADSGTRSTGAWRWATGMPRSRVSGVARRFGSPVRGQTTRHVVPFTTGVLGLVERDRRHVKLPRIGVVRTHESTLKLARHVERGTGCIRSATVSHRVGRWQVSFSVEITRNDPAPSQPDHRGDRPTGAGSPAAPSVPPCRPGSADPAGLLSAMASHPGPHRPPANRCRQRPPRRSAPTHHPPGAHPRHDRDRRPQASPAWEIVAWLATSRVSGVAASGRVQNRLVTKLRLSERTASLLASAGIVVYRARKLS
jgi:hypothetical protein